MASLALLGVLSSHQAEAALIYSQVLTTNQQKLYSLNHQDVHKIKKAKKQHKK